MLLTLSGASAVVLLSSVTVSAQVPPYITATPEAAARAFGSEVARKIFSDVFTPARQQAVLRSQKLIPGFECPADPRIALEQVVPFPLVQGAPSWIERYVVGCTPRTMRNFLVILEEDKPRVIELLPGTSNTDPLLQSDALKGGYTAIGPVMPANCDKPIVTDTWVAGKVERSAPWTERWSFNMCGTGAEVEFTFTLSTGSGTGWTASLVK